METMRSAYLRCNTKVVFTFMLTSFACLLIALIWRPGCPKQKLSEIAYPPCKEFNDFDDDSMHITKARIPTPIQSASHVPYSPIACVINSESQVDCRQENDEVYVPFTFLKKYFEVYGSIVDEGDTRHFDWQHSYSVVYPQRGKYSPLGVFMSFEHYNVETRSRVLCISAKEEVPMSIQWGKKGYFYAIQIAQYGLSHYSKNITEEKPKIIVLDDFESGELSDKYEVPRNPHTRAKIITENGNKVLEFKTGYQPERNGIRFVIDKRGKFLISLKFRFVNNGSISVVLKTTNHERVSVHYIQGEEHIQLRGKDVFYGLGSKPVHWRTLTRNIVLDYTKGLMLQYKKSDRQKVKNIVSRIDSIIFYGHGFTDDIVLTTSSHMTEFYSAADWLLANQDDKGGWPIGVDRRLEPGVLELKAGWYSAMAQGQAMSVLVRAYVKTKNRKYLISAMQASELFHKESGKGGILSKFLGVYDWYEEYPTRPSSYVLNGFIFSLIGLYDLKTVGSHLRDIDVVKTLYDNGMKSLRALLNHYDTGSGSFYDMRHVSAGLSPNVARWDYHTTHIIQLNLLATIDPDPVFKNTALRWLGYMKGRRAEHN